ncbi:hypothetical protein IMZ48_32275 [Candidatus Bathyarchaeota archaeon]|nr:hypothetical protein [Candidatus Bathyarchaeota archaeon]
MPFCSVFFVVASAPGSSLMNEDGGGAIIRFRAAVLEAVIVGAGAGGRGPGTSGGLSSTGER